MQVPSWAILRNVAAGGRERKNRSEFFLGKMLTRLVMMHNFTLAGRDVRVE